MDSDFIMEVDFEGNEEGKEVDSDSIMIEVDLEKTRRIWRWTQRNKRIICR